MDAHLFRPAIDSKGHFSVNGTDIIGHKDFSFGLMLDAGFGLIPFEGFEDEDGTLRADADRVDRLVEQMFTGTLHFNFGLFNHLVVGAQLPVVFAGGPAVEIPGFYNDSDSPSGIDYQGIGNVTLHAKWRLARSERDPVGLAAIVHVELPTGSPSEFVGDGFALWPMMALEWLPVRRVRIGLNLGYRFNTEDGPERFPFHGRTEPTGTSATVAELVQTGDPITYDDLLTFGMGASFRVARPLELVLETYGTQIATEIGARGGTSMEALAGLKVFVQQNSFLFLGGGVGIPIDGIQTADYRGVVGIVFEPSIGDRDGDGYRDDIDRCPDNPEDFDGFEDEDGCPEPDNDQDGILDLDDECPLIPEDFDGVSDEDGCPDSDGGDRDGDGILDADDLCPDNPEDFDGFEDGDGCPEPDNDQDGIPDADDLCPDMPEDYDGFEDEDGCPDADNDGDRVLDADDACPSEPETYNGFEDADGCPDRGTVVIEENQIVILERVYFETNSAVIQNRSSSLLDAVAATFIGNPQITLIEIQGHADERSSDAYNLRLTRGRAAAVLEALVQLGVPRNRLRSAGYGERCPVDMGHNRRAWERNRRVEFKIISTVDGPTDVEVACPDGQELIPD
ncbi:MAG: OmpA family protein [Myxococcota bacterium]